MILTRTEVRKDRDLKVHERFADDDQIMAGRNKVFHFIKNYKSPKLTNVFPGSTVCVSCPMPIRPYPRRMLMKSNTYPLLSSTSYSYYCLSFSEHPIAPTTSCSCDKTSREMTIGTRRSCSPSLSRPAMEIMLHGNYLQYDVICIKFQMV
jgi:hypothetical protein